MSTLHPLAYLREAERLVKQARLEAAELNLRTAKRLMQRANELRERGQ